MFKSSARMPCWPLLLGGAVSLICWLLLQRFYPLSALGEWGQFEIRKTPGHFNSPKVRLTTLLFVLMWASYAGVCYALWRNYRQKSTFSRALPWVGGPFVVAVAACAGADVSLRQHRQLLLYVRAKAALFLWRQSLYCAVRAALQRRSVRGLFGLYACDLRLRARVVLAVVARDCSDGIFRSGRDVGRLQKFGARCGSSSAVCSFSLARATSARG